MCPWLSLCTVAFKKLATVSLPSMMNLMFLWKELKALSRSSAPVVFWARSCICHLYISTALKVVTWIWLRTLFQVFP